MLPRSKSKRIIVGANTYSYLVTELGLALDADVPLAVTISAVPTTVFFCTLLA